MSEALTTRNVKGLALTMSLVAASTRPVARLNRNRKIFPFTVRSLPGWLCHSWVELADGLGWQVVSMTSLPCSGW
ncbi:MAG TPA: hypothetical protein VKP11_01390 [Frankiaceae bacterium]|nr:hypothetical protein [Frankiaceae bacterium]